MIAYPFIPLIVVFLSNAIHGFGLFTFYSIKVFYEIHFYEIHALIKNRSNEKKFHLLFLRRGTFSDRKSYLHTKNFAVRQTRLINYWNHQRLTALIESEKYTHTNENANSISTQLTRHEDESNNYSERLDAKFNAGQNKY